MELSKNPLINIVGINYKDQIPGSILNTCMMIWLTNIKKDYSDDLNYVNISRKSYLFRQIFFMINSYFTNNITLRELTNFFLNLKFSDKLLIIILPFHLNLIIRGLKKFILEDSNPIIKLSKSMNIYQFTRTRLF